MSKEIPKEVRESQEKAKEAGSFTGEAQHFSNIKRIFAKDGFVFIEVEAKNKQEGIHGNALKDGMLTIRDAASRATALNAMAHKFPKKDREVAMEIVDNVIAACKEAQIQAEAIAAKKNPGGLILPAGH